MFFNFIKNRHFFIAGIALVSSFVYGVVETESAVPVNNGLAYVQEEGGNMTSVTNQIGMSEDNRNTSVNMLNGILANEFVLLTQTLNFHWNIIGPEFHDYHLLFDQQYKDIFGYLDVIAERIRALGGVAIGTLAECLKIATIKEIATVPAPRKMVEILLENHAALIKQLRLAAAKTAEGNADIGTSNFLTDLLEKHEKTGWMLRSLLEK